MRKRNGPANISLRDQKGNVNIMKFMNYMTFYVYCSERETMEMCVVVRERQWRCVL